VREYYYTFVEGDNTIEEKMANLSPVKSILCETHPYFSHVSVAKSINQLRNDVVYFSSDKKVAKDDEDDEERAMRDLLAVKGNSAQLKEAINYGGIETLEDLEKYLGKTLFTFFNSRECKKFENIGQYLHIVNSEFLKFRKWRGDTDEEWNSRVLQLVRNVPELLDVLDETVSKLGMKFRLHGNQ